METLWGPQGCGDHMGTTCRQHADNVGINPWVGVWVGGVIGGSMGGVRSND